MIYPGYIMARIARWADEHSRKVKGDNSDHLIVILNHQENALHGIHQSTVLMSEDRAIYRLIVAPADAPIFIGDAKLPIDHVFPYRLLEWPGNVEPPQSLEEEK